MATAILKYWRRLSSSYIPLRTPARVWDETDGAETDLGGALYDGQRLKVE